MIKYSRDEMNAQAIFKLVADRYQTTPAYLWQRYPDYAVLRHADNQKWYGLVMAVSKSDLGLVPDDETLVEVLDVKLDPEDVELLQTEPAYLPAYHMNKRHWITVQLDQVEPAVVARLLATSYQLTTK